MIYKMIKLNLLVRLQRLTDSLTISAGKTIE